MSKEGKKANGGQREEGCWGCVGERRAVMEESMEGESLGCSGTSRTKTQVQQSGGGGVGGKQVGWEPVLMQRVFPAAALWRSVQWGEISLRLLQHSKVSVLQWEYDCQAGRGDGKGGGRGAGHEDGYKKSKKKKKHPSTVFQLDWTNGENGQPIAVLTAFNAFSSWIIEDAPKENGRQQAGIYWACSEGLTSIQSLPVVISTPWLSNIHKTSS